MANTFPRRDADGVILVWVTTDVVTSDNLVRCAVDVRGEMWMCDFILPRDGDLNDVVEMARQKFSWQLSDAGLTWADARRVPIPENFYARDEYAPYYVTHG